MIVRTHLGTTALCAALAGCGSTPTPPPARPSVLLITLDTTRADRLGAWGYDGAHTPNLDALAAAGRRYENAYSPVPFTIPSHAAMMTGRYPAHLGVRDNSGATLSEDATTLAELLRGAGYATGASIAAFVTTKRWGFAQGFDTYLDEIPPIGKGNFWHASRPAAAVIDDAIGWLKGQPADGAPLFLWVHLYDAHHPYEPSPASLALADGRPYDGEIASMDAEIGRLMEAWGDRASLVVVAGDHGESLGDHRELEHGLFTYTATQHVPLLMTGAGVVPGVVSSPVSLVDLAPTVLHAVGVPIPADVDGVDLSAPPQRPVYFESWALRDRFGLAPHVGVVQGSLSYLDLPQPELYDLAADSAQAKNLFVTDPERAAKLAPELKGALTSFGFAAPGTDNQNVDASITEQLAALGYVQGSFEGDADGELPDPKDHMALIVGAERVDRLIARGEREQAVALLQTLGEANPTVVELFLRKGGLLMRLGRPAEERAALLHALDVSPDSVNVIYALAASYARAGDYATAAPLYQKVADRQPWLPRVRVEAVAALLAQPTKRGEAVTLGRSYLSAFPDDNALAGIIGVATVASDPVGAYPLLERGLLAEKPERDVALLLARRAQAQGDDALAAKLAAIEVHNFPGDDDAVAMALAALGKVRDYAGLVEVADVALAVKPESEAVLHARAQAQFNLGDLVAARRSVDEALALHPRSAILALLDANLLAKEGKPEQAKARFEVAQRLQAATLDRLRRPAPPKP